MMKELLLELKRYDIDVNVEKGKLKLNIPKGLDAETILRKVKDNKDELLAYIEKNALENHRTYPVKIAETKEFYNLSAAQRRLYILYELDKNSLAYNNPSVTKLEGRLQTDKFKAAIDKLINRHESLRTSFDVIKGQPVQKISKDCDFKLEIYTAGQSDPDEIINRFLRPFDLAHCPLFRVGLIELSARESLLLTDMHHIIGDAFSSDVLIRDFMTFYKDEELPSLDFQYKDYVEWSLSGRQKKKTLQERNFWLDEYAQKPAVLEIPADFVRSPKRNDKASRLWFELDKNETGKLREISGKDGISLFMVLFSVFNILLSKVGSQDDIVVGVPVTDRRYGNMDNIIGMFANTLALRNHPLGSLRFVDFLSTVKSKTLACFENQSYSYENLLNELNIERDASRNALFDIVFVFQNSGTAAITVPGLTFTPHESELGVSKFDIILEASESEGKVLLSFEYNTRLFKKETITRFSHYFKRIVSAILSDPAIHISQISLLSAKEEHQLLNGFNDTQVDYPTKKTMVDLFEEQAKKTPDNIALCYGEDSMTYAALSALSDKVSCYLQIALGISTGDLVGVMLERDLYLIPVIMGVLKAGAAYVPIDPRFPRERINSIVDDSKLKVLVTRGAYAFPGTGSKTSWLDLDSQMEIIKDYRVTFAGGRACGSDLAYVIYTSGSTGSPKGVMIEHHAVVNRILWMQSAYGLTLSDVLLQKTPVIFDVSVWELFWWSVTGASLCVLPPGAEGDPRSIIAAVERYQVTVMHFVPSMLSAFLSVLQAGNDQRRLKSLRRVFSSGEALKPEHVSRFREGIYQYNKTELINLYGPTEATVDVSYYRCKLEAGENAIVPIGKPIDNTQLYVLDSSLRPCPVGVRGELCISGVGLSRGYLSNEKLTAEKFVDHPYKEGMKLYRTGDLAHWQADGNIVYLGRIDNQVKLRGYRIELNEIESRLSSHAQVSEAVVVVHEQGEDKYLAGYYVSECDIPASELRMHLSTTLPDYMVPVFFIRLEQMPLTVSGKADRRKLPRPQLQVADYAAPSNEIEEKLTEIWSKILKIEREKISIDVSFFSIGGYSLNAISAIYLIYEELKYEMSLMEFFNNSTIKQMAECIVKNMVVDITI